jgi:hypothetical protein
MIEQLMMVAGATIVMTIIGMIIGFSFVKREIPIQFSPIFTKGIEFYRYMFKSIDFSFLFKR